MRSRTNGGGAAGVQPETATATRLLTPPHGSPNNLVVAWSIVQLFLPMQSCWTMAVVVLRVEQTWPLASCETGSKARQDQVSNHHLCWGSGNAIRLVS